MIGVGLLGLGFLFSSQWIMACAALLILYLLIEGIRYHHMIEETRDSIEVKTRPKSVETTVGRSHRIETVVKNYTRANLRILGLSHDFPPEIHEETHQIEFLVPANREQRITTIANTEFPGRFKVTGSTVTLETNTRLFRQSMKFPDDFTLIVWPMIVQTKPLIEVSGLRDLSVDITRRGVGTDLAGIRPMNLLDDFRSIYWKATARAGKWMAKEFYLERDPAIMLLIDVSSLTKTFNNRTLFDEVAILMSNKQLASSAIGSILYDEGTVIENIRARSGTEHRERILSTLLGGVKSASTSFGKRAIRAYAKLAKETYILAGESHFSGKVMEHRKRFKAFGNLILPFYSGAASRYRKKLRAQGVFKAFGIVFEFSEPMLIIVIPGDKTDLYGLYEGAKHAAILNHRVIIAIPPDLERTVMIEEFLDLEGLGVRTLKRTHGELGIGMGSEIIAMKRTRRAPVNRL